MGNRDGGAHLKMWPLEVQVILLIMRTRVVKSKSLKILS